MGLSGRKEKQRISNDPRNLSWADNAAKFGQTYLEKFGWDESQGLGASGSGRTSHIKVTQKLDMLGIGAANQRDPNGIAWKQNRDFENLLKRLNEANGVEEDGSQDEKHNKRAGEAGDIDTGKKRKKAKPSEREPEPLIVAPKPSTARPMLHRARSRASKNIASKSPSAIAEILGIAPTPALSCTSTSTSTPSTPPTLTQLDEDPTMGRQTTSTKSVADYFRERLLAKSLGNSPPSTPKLAEDEDHYAPRARLGSKSHLQMPQSAIDSLSSGHQSSKILSFKPSTSLPATDIEVNIPQENTQRKDDTRKREKKKKVVVNEENSIERRDKTGKKDKKKRKKESTKDVTSNDAEAETTRAETRTRRRVDEGGNDTSNS